MLTSSSRPSQIRFAPLSTVGIGSVPYREGKNSCAGIFKDWDIPFWPQYPGRTLRENLIFQFLSSFPGLEVSESAAAFNEAVFLQHEDSYRKNLERTLSSSDDFSFEPPPGWALGYSEMKDLLSQGAFPEKRVIKLQVTGPETVWKSFFSKNVSPSLAEGIREALGLSLQAAGLAQIHRASEFGKTPLIFIDEPILADDLSFLRHMISTFKRNAALVGLHVCSNTHWQGFTNLDLDVFHFDVTAHRGFGELQRNFIQTHLQARKWVAWGVVPTGQKTGLNIAKIDYGRNFLKQIERIADKKLLTEEVLNHSLLAPGCGAGTLRSQEEQAVFESLRVTAMTLKTHWLKDSQK